MKTITISWEPVAANHTIYSIDGSAVGEDNIGFDKILETVRSNRGIQVTLKIRGMSSLGGESLIDSFPFSDRFDELTEALGENKLNFEFS